MSSKRRLGRDDGRQRGVRLLQLRNALATSKGKGGNFGGSFVVWATLMRSLGKMRPDRTARKGTSRLSMSLVGRVLDVANELGIGGCGHKNSQNNYIMVRWMPWITHASVLLCIDVCASGLLSFTAAKLKQTQKAPFPKGSLKQRGLTFMFGRVSSWPPPCFHERYA